MVETHPAHQSLRSIHLPLKVAAACIIILASFASNLHSQKPRTSVLMDPSNLLVVLGKIHSITILGASAATLDFKSSL
jgi:hypothetical protein